MKTSILGVAFIFISLNIYAQYNFILQGNFVFERRINAYALLEKEFENDIKFVEDYKSRYPRFDTSLFYLHFNEKSSYYEPIQNKIGTYFSFLDKAAYNNKVYNEFESDSIFQEKELFEKKISLFDKKREITWKLTDENRQIAGFECRRANGLVMDSIYVVAFFSQEIPINGGPESFNGLPGMILGLAIPKYHVSWFAKYLTLNNNDSIIKPFKKEYYSYKSLKETLDSILKNYNPKSIERLYLDLLL